MYRHTGSGMERELKYSNMGEPFIMIRVKKTMETYSKTAISDSRLVKDRDIRIPEWKLTNI